jgi:hypothetical protein
MQLLPHKKFGQNWPTHESLHKIHLGRACQPVSHHFTAFVLLLKTGQYNRTIQKSELKTKKQDWTIKKSELKTNQHNRPIQKSELKTKKQDRTIKESELKTNRYNRPIQKSELGINRLYRPIQSEDRIGIGKSINRTFRPPLCIRELYELTGEIFYRVKKYALSTFNKKQNNFLGKNMFFSIV